MFADEFVAELRKGAPSVQSLQSVGLSSEQAHRFRQRSLCPARSCDELPDNKQPVQDLIRRFDTSKLEIGMLRFTGMQEQAGLLLIGQAEADLLVVERGTGEIQVRDHHQPDRIMWRCAVAEAAFLDALLPLACFLTRGATNELPWNDQELNCSEASRFAMLAGGTDYLDFYKVMTGCDD